MRTVKEMLDSKYKPNNYTTPASLVIDALRKLNDLNLSYLIVMESDAYKGIFTERDYTRNVVLKGKSSKEATVQEVMTTNLPQVAPAQTVEDCMYMMNTKGARYLAVFEDDHFLGIITIHDILREVIANKEYVFDHTLTNSLLDNDESGKVF